MKTTTETTVVTGTFRPSMAVRLLQKVQNWNNRRNAVRQLNQMSDVLLNDLGIGRHEITEVVNQSGFYNEQKRKVAQLPNVARMTSPLARAA